MTAAAHHRLQAHGRPAGQTSATAPPIVRIEGLTVPAACPFRGDATGSHGERRARLRSVPGRTRQVGQAPHTPSSKLVLQDPSAEALKVATPTSRAVCSQHLALGSGDANGRWKPHCPALTPRRRAPRRPRRRLRAGSTRPRSVAVRTIHGGVRARQNGHPPARGTARRNGRGPGTRTTHHP